MYKPYTPEEGMRVTYGRSGFNRTGWKGIVIAAGSNNFRVEWDEVNSGEPTTYSLQAWAQTQFEDRWRDRDKHYIFFDESSVRNKKEFPRVFSCEAPVKLGTAKLCALSRTQTKPFEKQVMENEPMKKTLVKQTLVNGTNLTSANEEQLIQLICDLEGDVNRLSSIKVESKRINEMVEELQKAIKAVVKELDSRD